MTEELRQEAEKKADIYVKDKYDEDDDCWTLEYARFVEGYIAGAKAHQTQWHDLRENPDDVPSTCRDVYVYLGPYDRLIGRYWGKQKGWEIEGVIAWCELPKFEG